MNPASLTAGPVNAITVLTLLDKLVNMLDTVQENQHKMEGRQAEMEGAVRGIQADMTKLSKSHSHTSNTVSKLLDKSRKVSVTMKEVRDRMERQAGQVKKLEVNHAHLLKRNNFKVLIFQEENEIPSSVFVKEPVPFPHEEEEGEESKPDANRSQEEGLQTIDLSSDEDVGLEAELEEEGLEDLHELSGEPLERSRTDKFKRSSLKKVDSLKKAFSRQNIEKKMTKISTKIVSQEQRDKIKKSLTPNNQKNPFKVSPLSFSIRKRPGSESQPEAEVEASSETKDSPTAVASIELSPVGSTEQDLSFTEVHSQLAPELEEAKAAGDAQEKEEESGTQPETNGVPEPEEIPESNIPEAELLVTEEVSEAYALSATLPQEESLSAPPCYQEEEGEEIEETNKEEEEVMPEQKKEEMKEVGQKEEKEKESPVEEKA